MQKKAKFIDKIKTFVICKLSVLEIFVIKPIYNNSIKVMDVIITIFTMSLIFFYYPLKYQVGRTQQINPI